MGHLSFFIVNAFSGVPFRGNPATVVVVPRDDCKRHGRSEDDTTYFMQLSKEIGQVETVFVIPAVLPKTDFKLRFFTKTKEMSFCGHATLAAAHVLHTEYSFPSDVLYFSTQTGVVVVKCADRKTFEMDLSPTLPHRASEAFVAQYREPMARALSIDPQSVVDMLLHDSTQNVILILDAAQTVARAALKDPSALIDASPPGVAKVTITATPRRRDAKNGEGPGSDGMLEDRWRKYDFVTRLFAPKLGIAEDAVSGASHGVLAQLWRSREQTIREKADLLCFQASPRGGELRLRVHGGRVGVIGEAVTVAKGWVPDHHASL